jgi:hypothetical protein
MNELKRYHPSDLFLVHPVGSRGLFPVTSVTWHIGVVRRTGTLSDGSGYIDVHLPSYQRTQRYRVQH